MQKTKKVIRKVAELAAQILILPSWLSYNLHARLMNPPNACVTVSQQASRWPGLTGIYRRRALYKQVIARMGEDVTIGMGTILTKPTIELGTAVYVGSYCVVGDVRIGDHSLISDYVSLVSGHHGIEPDRPIKDQPERYRTIHIGEDCWVGSRAVILADLGNHAVVGAGSVVTKPVPDYMIVAGNPARPIGDRRQRKHVQPNTPSPSSLDAKRKDRVYTGQPIGQHPAPTVQCEGGNQ